MKTITNILFLCGIIMFTEFSCKKEKPEAIEVLVELVNDNNVVIDTFEKGDSVLFKFYLTNNMGREVTYVRPSYEILNFLKVFKQNLNGDYEYIGQPHANFVMVCIIDKINDNETKLLGGVPITNEFNWPEINPGNYYVGDTLKLTIDDERRHFESRIYFTIKGTSKNPC